jgi:hypothetical protein
MRITNRKGAKDAKEDDFFRIGTSRLLRLWQGTRAIRKGIQPSGQSTHIAGQLVPEYRQCPLSEADRLFSFADLRIGKRKLSVLGALSEAGGSSFSLVTLATISKNLSAIRITL